LLAAAAEAVAQQAVEAVEAIVHLLLVNLLAVEEL
jgi:hypothetical protein